jgi:hypothetical protein
MQLSVEPDKCRSMGKNGRQCVEVSFNRNVISLEMEKILAGLSEMGRKSNL